MQSVLQAEFSRLGIDPEKVTAKAPQKVENTTFDLAISLSDSDGPGGNPREGIALSWTECLVGDYNQDGMVTGSDLTPLGQNYSMSTNTPKADYDDPSLHDGITYWPSGDPRGEGALNWRMARIDGNHDGHILLYDITPIAIHWEERLTGYRVWRKPPDSATFSLVPSPDGTVSGETILRPDLAEITNDAPVVYDFIDTEAVAGGLGDGVYAYYIEPWDGSSQTSGPASLIAVIDTTGVTVPERPVASVTVTPDFAGAPAQVTFDATGSHDSDGTVEVYHWDFDCDAVIDWVSTDPLPEESSSGSVDTITSDADGIVTVTYRSGSADWYYPSVTVTDNDGLSSTPAYAKLGISGWEHEMVGNDEGLAVLKFHITAVGQQPNTGIEIAAGYVQSSTNSMMPWINGQEPGLYFAWCDSPGTWTTEQVANRENPAWAEYYHMRPGAIMEINHLFWDESNQPGLLIRTDAGMATDGHVYIAQRRPNGTWDLTEVYAGVLPLNLSHRGVIDIKVADQGPGQIVAILDEIVEGSVYGSTLNYQLLWYDNGDFSIEETGIVHHSQTWKTGDRIVYDIAVDSNGLVACLLDEAGQTYPNELWVTRRESPGNWTEARWDTGNLEPAGAIFFYGGCVYDEADRLQVTVNVIDGEGPVIHLNECRLYSCSPGNVQLEQSVAVSGSEFDDSVVNMGEGSGIGFFLNDADGYFHCRLEPDSGVKEEIWSNATYQCIPKSMAYGAYPGGKAYSALYTENYDNEELTKFQHFFSRRLDPRY